MRAGEDGANRPPRQPPYCPRQEVKPPRQPHRAVAVIPAKQLVTAVAAQCDFDVPSSSAGEGMCGQSRRVGERLPEDADQLGQVVNRIRSHAEFMVFSTQVLRNAGGVLSFIVSRV